MKGDKIVALNGSNAGKSYEVIQVDDPLGDLIGRERNIDGREFSLHRNFNLLVKIDTLRVPPWMPPLCIRDCFVLDEIAIWFVGRGLGNNGFFWNVSDFLQVTAIIWDKRLPIEPVEFAEILFRHGLPGAYQERVERDFEFSLRAMRCAAGKPSIKKKRKALSASQEFSELVRRSYQ